MTSDSMARREFLKRGLGAGIGLSMAGGAGAGSSLVACSSGEEAGSASGFQSWVWVHGNSHDSREAWTREFDRLGGAGFTGVLASGGDLDLLSPAARGAGLSFHRWMWALNRSGDEWARTNHPEWFTVSREGQSSLDAPPYVGYYRWVCPTREPVKEYVAGLAGELAEDERVDGVHLDYIRHCDVILPRGLWDKYDLVQDTELPEFDFCYCDECRRVFEARTGRDPAALPDPPADEDWRRFRWDSVTELVTRVSETVHSVGKPVTAAVFPTPTVARRLVRQAWDEWPLDAVFPMLYHGFYLEDLAWIGEGIREARAAGVGAGLGGRPWPGDARPGPDSATAPPDTLFAGLYLPDLTPSDAADAVAIARDAGADGVSFFELGGLSDEHLAAVRGVLAVT